MRRSRLMACFREARLAADRRRPEAARPARRRVGQARDLAARPDRSRQARDALLRRLLVGVGQLHGPCPLFAGIDLEEAGAVKAARQAILGALDRELLVARAHKGLPRPLAAAVIIERVDVIEAGNQGSLQQGLTASRGHVPPALGGPSLRILVAERDSDPAGGVVAEAEVRGGRIVPAAEHEQRRVPAVRPSEVAEKKRWRAEL